jgi:ketosteroid isomerase-like protein
MNDNEKTVRQAVEAFTSGDMATVQSIFADDVVVHVPPGLPISGDHHGWDAFVNDMLNRMVAALDGPPRSEVRDFTASDDHVVGLYTLHVERNRLPYEWRHTNTYRVVDGRIAELWWSPFEFETAKQALGG